jgi:TetR/AcrR family transcriptional repressor of nem operon
MHHCAATNATCFQRVENLFYHIQKILENRPTGLKLIFMKRKGETTRERIVEQTASLLNCTGYLRTPVSEIMRVTGLQKGGIYNHFESRQALTLEAFEFAAGRMRDRLLEALAGKRSAKDKLCALIKSFRDGTKGLGLEGGCPIVNLAIESDDADPELRSAARRAMGRLIGLFEKTIAQGVEEGEFAKRDVRESAVHMVAALEGALMLSNLYKDPNYLRIVAHRLEDDVKAWR